MIRVLIVEDSKVVSEYLRFILEQDKSIEVIGTVNNGKQAIEFIKNKKPNVVTMDVDMPEMNGLEATRQIMSTTPVPILIVTASHNSNEVNISIEALAAGALAVVEKPLGITHPKAEELSRKLVNLVKVLSEVSVVTRRKAPFTPPVLPKITNREYPKITEPINPSIVVIGVSSGGPQTLQTVFSKITQNFPAPIVVVQHIAPGFIEGLASWIEKQLKIPVSVAIDGETVKAGHIYFAPDNHQIGLTPAGKVTLEKRNGNGGFCPSIAYLINNTTQSYGKRALGIILTGMGSDGAEELKQMRQAGAITIVQDKESSLIYGIPGVAAQIGAASYILSDEEISKVLSEIEKKAL